jgi:hypothetical protein
MYERERERRAPEASKIIFLSNDRTYREQVSSVMYFKCRHPKRKRNTTEVVIDVFVITNMIIGE